MFGMKRGGTYVVMEVLVWLEEKQTYSFQWQL
jgi:hypothetical protein